MTAVVASSTAMAAVAGSSTAMQAVIANSTALNKVVSSQTAMTAVASSATARGTITSSSTAKTALANSPLKKTVTSSNGSYGSVVSGRCFIISVKNNNSGNTSARTHYFRYVFSGTSATTTTAEFSATYATATAVNMFTDTNGISYYNNDAIPGLITYIQC